MAVAVMSSQGWRTYHILEPASVKFPTQGRKRAVANGVKFGPKFKLNSFQRQEALARLAAGESQSIIAKTYGVDPATISRLQGKAARQD